MGRWTVTARRGAQSLGVYPITAEQTILDALDEANIRIPRSCTSGTCGTCMMSLLEGEIAPIDEILPGLDDDGLPDEAILSCQAHPTSDVVVDIRTPF